MYDDNDDIKLGELQRNLLMMETNGKEVMRVCDLWSNISDYDIREINGAYHLLEHNGKYYICIHDIEDLTKNLEKNITRWSFFMRCEKERLGEKYLDIVMEFHNDKKVFLRQLLGDIIIKCYKSGSE